MRVDRDPLDLGERVAQDDVRRLARHARQRVERLHGVGHRAAVGLDDPPTRAADRPRLLVEEPGRLDVDRELRLRHAKVVLRGPVLREQAVGSLCHLVHALVRALRRQDRRDQHLQGSGERQRDLRIRIRLRQQSNDLRRPLLRGALPREAVRRPARHQAGPLDETCGRAVSSTSRRNTSGRE